MKINTNHIISQAIELFKKNWKILFSLIVVSFIVGAVIELAIYAIEYPYKLWDEEQYKYVANRR